MKQISRWPVVQQIAPWIAGVITVFFGIFLVGLAVTHQTMLGAESPLLSYLSASLPSSGGF